VRLVNRLTEKTVRNAEPDPGKFVKKLPDGNRLYLQVTRSTGGGVNRNWVYRYGRDGAEHWMGLGSLLDVGLAAARQKARQLGEQMALDGADPLEAREVERAERRAKVQAARAEKARALTFAECAAKYHVVHGSKWHPKHAAQWLATLKEYAFPVIGDLNVADIDEAHLVRVLQPIWAQKHVTAQRVRGRIEAVLGYATVAKFRTGDNPARWRNHLQTLLGGAQKVIEHHAALSFAEVPAFMSELRDRPTMSARALEFLILTAARTGEVIGARWSEIDLQARTWTIPATRMKAKNEHRVPLSPRAVEILKGLPRKGEFVFGSAVTGKPLHDDTLLDLLRRARSGVTTHGFRSTFHDWCSERTNYPNHVVEMALAHAIPTAVEKAYRRGDLFEKRRKLMEAWAAFLDKPITSATVTPIGKAVGHA
jgi:integrase